MKNQPISKKFQLTGNYSIENFRAVLDIIKKLDKQIVIDYSSANVDTGIRVLLDNFNGARQENHANGQHSLNEAQKTRKALLDRAINRPLKMEQGQIEVLKAEYLKTEYLKTHEGFFKYIMHFIGGIFIYVKDVAHFGIAILFKRPKHEFQRQIMIEDMINNCYNMGLQAIPIILFLSCAWGVIGALQSSAQLKIFGAEFHAIDLVIFMFFKAMGLLLSLVVLSARSGSSMIAKIGIMRISDEWNSLLVLGIDPEIFLLKPKVLAFTVLMPFLAYISCVAGIIGGYVVLQSTIGMSSGFLLETLVRVLSFDLFAAILWKGLIFGLLIGIICAFEARNVSVNSESVVLAITRGVVYSVFACVLADMFLNIISVGAGI